MITSIVSAVFIFALLIIVHEAGHFAMAKRLGVRVLRFSVGYPPRIAGVRRGETDYAIGATPLGGYVRMLGDEIAEEPSSQTLENYLKEIELDLLGAARSTGWLKQSGKSDDEALKAMADELTPAQSDLVRGESTVAGDSLSLSLGNRQATGGAVSMLGREIKADEAALLREIQKSGSVKRAIETLAASRPSALMALFNARAFPSQRLGKRIAIVAAGPLANILFAPILMTIVLMVGVPTLLPMLGTVKQDLPGYLSGLRPGDRIISVDGQPIDSWDELSTTIRASAGKTLNLVVKRPSPAGPTEIKLVLKAKLVTEQTIYGDKAPTWVIGVTPRGDMAKKSLSPFAAARTGVTESARMVTTLVIGMGKIISGATPVRQALGGPIMIAQMAGKEARQGFAEAAIFTVMLSLELGIINLLPVPLLDGGHLLFFVIEGVRGKPLQLRHREIAMQVGLFLLAILMAFVILNDLSRLIG
jgi:regulator of sigma E protease